MSEIKAIIKSKAVMSSAVKKGMQRITGQIKTGGSDPAPTGGYHFVFVYPVIFETGDINAANVYSDVDLSPVQQPGGV